MIFSISLHLSVPPRNEKGKTKKYLRRSDRPIALLYLLTAGLAPQPCYARLTPLRGCYHAGVAKGGCPPFVGDQYKNNFFKVADANPFKSRHNLDIAKQSG